MESSFPLTASLASRPDSTVTTYPKLFVVGCPRSGTTWLRQLLACHPHILSAPRETHLYRLVYKPFTYVPKMDWAQRFKQRVWFVRHYGIRAMMFGASSASVWRGVLRSYRFYEKSSGNVGPHTVIGYQDFKALIQAVRQEPINDLERAKQLIKTVLDRYFVQAGGEADTILLEKTPMHLDCSDIILKQFPEAKIIVVTRDGRDVCASWQARAKTQKWARRSTEQLIKQWNRCVELTQTFQADPQLADRICTVRYEDLRRQPAAELAALLDFLALNHTPEQVKGFVDQLDIENVAKKGEGQHVRKGTVGDWRQSLSEKDIHLWQTRARDTLLQMGYPV